MTVVALLVFPLRGKEGDEKDAAESAVYSSNATKIRNSRGRRFVIIPIMQQPHHFSRLKEDVKTIRIGVPFVGCGWSVVGCQRENRKPPSSLFEIRWFVFCEEGEEGHVMERDNRQTWWLWSDASEGQAPSSRKYGVMDKRPKRDGHKKKTLQDPASSSKAQKALQRRKTVLQRRLPSSFLFCHRRGHRMYMLCTSTVR